MTGFVRENIYRLQIGNDVQARQFLCMEFMGLTGAPAARAWIETEVPREFDRNFEEWKGGHIDKTDSVWVYGREILQKKRVTTADMATYWACDALAKEAIIGTEAGSFVHLVLHEWFINGPKARTKVLQKAAPEWWALITEKDGS